MYHITQHFVRSNFNSNRMSIVNNNVSYPFVHGVWYFVYIEAKKYISGYDKIITFDHSS